jgi:hypothetical protein
MHQLTPNAIYSYTQCVCIWTMRNQSVNASAKGFCRIHELYYHMKVRRSDDLHNNFACRKNM